MIAKSLTRFGKDNATSSQAILDGFETFEKLKQTLFSTPILRIPNWEKSF